MGAFLDHSGSGSHVYLRPSTGGGEVRATRRETADAYVPVRASHFYTSSSRLYKTNIEELKETGLSMINELTIVQYDLIDDIENGILDNRQVGLISEDSPSIATDDEMAINTYKLVSYNAKATQELSEEVDRLNQRLDQVGGPLILDPFDIDPDFTIDTVGEAYPIGYTLLSVDNTMGFPPGILTTIKLNDEMCSQTLHVTGTSGVHVRTSPSGVWTPFREM